MTPLASTKLVIFFICAEKSYHRVDNPASNVVSIHGMGTNGGGGPRATKISVCIFIISQSFSRDGSQFVEQAPDAVGEFQIMSTLHVMLLLCFFFSLYHFSFVLNVPKLGPGLGAGGVIFIFFSWGERIWRG